jgi:hypothetical protein
MNYMTLSPLPSGPLLARNPRTAENIPRLHGIQKFRAESFSLAQPLFERAADLVPAAGRNSRRRRLLGGLKTLTFSNRRRVVTFPRREMTQALTSPSLYYKVLWIICTH